VLIVEDNRAARTAIAKLLKRQGFAVSEAASVAEAMDGIAQPPPPQWILLDLMLPDGCGINVLRKARAEQMPCTVCVITGCADSQLLAEARRAGAEHTFTKPLDVERLMTLMCA
jgi:DNA-binding response OmpR family regulator